MGIIERIGALAGSDAAKAVNFAHETFQTRLGVHGHHGRALLETFVEVCRNHPNLMGIAAGILVEQLLVREKHHHEAELAREAAGGGHPEPHHPPPSPHKVPVIRQAAPHAPHHELRIAQIRPMKLALEVFGAILLLKFSAGVAKALRRKNRREIWFSPLAKVHLFSASLATYYGAKAIKAKRISAWRNAACVLFFTDAIKPVLKAEKRYAQSLHPAPAAIPPPPPHAPEPLAAPVAAAAVEPVHHEEPAPAIVVHHEPHHEEAHAAPAAHHGNGHDDHGHVHAPPAHYAPAPHAGNGADLTDEEPPPPHDGPGFHRADEGHVHQPAHGHRYEEADLEPEPDAPM
jgi:hypothetical protein